MFEVHASYVGAIFDTLVEVLDIGRLMTRDVQRVEPSSNVDLVSLMIEWVNLYLYWFKTRCGYCA